MKKMLTTVFLLAGLIAYGQDYTDPQNIKIETTRDAQYPGGEDKLYQDIYYNLKYSEEAKSQKIETTVMTSFFVEADSTVTGIRVINDPGAGCGDSLKVFLGKSKFHPALLNGTPFKSQLMLNIPLRAH